MQKDFAPKAKRPAGARFLRGARVAHGARNAKDKTPRVFSAGSFVAGVVCCAIAVFAVEHAPPLAAFLPGDEHVAEESVAAAAPKLKYEFMDRLPKEVVRTHVDPYQPVLEAPAADPGTQVYLLQAASFLRENDAHAMRAELLLEGMEANVSEVPRAAGGAWHRVLVGPFADRVEMRRALTQLRAKDIPALPLVRETSGGQTPG